MSNATTQILVARDAPKPDEIRAHVREILKSPAFQGSKRSQQFLVYVCEESLAGGAAALKERTIAVEVFGRNPKSDLADDTIVRVGAREVRKRLVQYYLTPEGAAALVRIDLPTGSYAPEFHYAGITPPPEAPPDIPSAVRPARLPVWNILLVAAAALVIAVAAFLSVRWLRPNPGEQAFSRFWEPVFRSDDPLLLAMAHPIVYHPSARAWQLSERRQPPQQFNVPRPIQVAADELNGSDMLPVQNQYVGFGDMAAANEVTSMLGLHAKRVRVRLASGIGFPDLRDNNTLLIGAISNRWTMQLQQGWRFQFRWTPAVRSVVVDTSQPHRQWFVDSKEDEAYQEDYVVVGRIRNSPTGGLLLVGAGLKGFGTEAAGRLLVDAGQLGNILGKLPAGWETKNLQIVLHVKVIGNTPAQPDVVAWHVW
ncbi:MAG TPA: hypothetical protein VGL72_29545 [Bryobacteraceae bacterium]|jgi:hypothetical protein